MGVVQNRCFRCGCPWAVVCTLIPGFGPVCSGSRVADLGAHPPGVSGVGSRPLIGVLTHLSALGLCTHAAGPLIWVHPDPGFGPIHLGSWAADQVAHPPGVSVVGIQAADQGACPPGVSGTSSLTRRLARQCVTDQRTDK